MLLLLACGTDVQIAKEEQEVLSTQERLGLSDAEANAILAFLEDCTTTFDLLDGAVGLDSDAAENLVQTRDGSDGQCGTDDDPGFATLDDVSAVSQVGDQTILDILAYIEGGTPDTGEWEGVAFTSEEATAVLEIANQATEAQLTDGAGLASDEAGNIVDARPIGSMDELAEVPQVGKSALQKLKDYIGEWNG